ncbi:hypothetical protein RirG_225430 [Rhizophagus irregularis DAOM 197198w]|uniref:DUF8211 domain-containing protein n=1 Tax=Rhizophagus irregularis (strain DAOM 197198w) TaxID=1432141 RepID=A0A015IMJ7_RHIIW|nr:hypothetical protein RirG_225430 [Rhizophagus irregularis DAOM 197198w]
MTSSNFIEIDFFSVSYESLKSYSQLDAISDIRSNIAEDGLAENNVLDTNIQLQNTLLSTIPVHTPLCLSPPSCKNNSFLISFKKFHVTRIHKSGYNKIYEFRRSKSFFFEIVDHHLDTNQLHLKIHTNDDLMSTTPIKYHSTSALPNAKYQISKGLQHFFSSQRVIPRRIQHKYFNMIRQKLLDRITFIKSREYKIKNKNTTTKTFFNFSYGCGLHFFKKYPDGLTFIRNENGDLTPKIQSQNKELHAKLIFDRWINKELKSIFSSRTGISYNSRYIVCNSNRKINPGRTHMYHKLMNNFRSTPSPNSRTAKRQQMRFERSCHRILLQEVIKPGAVSSTLTKLAAAKKGRFLFLPSQKFTTPLKHLRYKKTVDIPKQKDYNFTIPHYFGANTNTTKASRTTNNISIVTDSTLIPASNDELLYTVIPYNPIPDMFIPLKYRDIIPPDPIYDNFGSFIIPGSREWFTYMYQLDLNTRDERLEKAEDAKFAARMDELYAESVAAKLRY